MTEKTGTLYGIGVGPGDPELLTLKAVRLLQRVAVVAYPAPESGESLARQIAAPHFSAPKEEIRIIVPMTPGASTADAAYDAAAEAIAAQLRSGCDVALLCLGDPFMYGSFMYVFERLGKKFPVHVVPGISAAHAAAAASLFPLTRREEVFSVIPATLDDEALRARLEGCQSAAIFKVGRHFGRVRALLRAMGLEKNARYIAHASLPHERVASLDEVADDEASYFSLILLRREKA